MSMSGSGTLPPGSIPPYPSSGPTGPSWHTPNTSYASIAVAPPKPRGTMRIAVGGLVVAGLALGAGVGLGWRSRGTGDLASSTPAISTKPAEVAKAAAFPPPSATALPGPASTVSAEPPSISVDSLPGTIKPLGPVPRGAGRLLVTTSPGWCNLTIDGKERGPTPVVGIDLPSGAHQLRCDAPGGKIKTQSVTVHEGATSIVKIAFEE